MRCGSIHFIEDRVYRCVMETREEDGHTEHQYNYFRKATPRELQLLKEAEERIRLRHAND